MSGAVELARRPPIGGLLAFWGQPYLSRTGHYTQNPRLQGSMSEIEIFRQLAQALRRDLPYDAAALAVLRSGTSGVRGAGRDGVSPVYSLDLPATQGQNEVARRVRLRPVRDWGPWRVLTNCGPVAKMGVIAKLFQERELTLCLERPGRKRSNR
jgi:hypothetical protein